MFTVAKKSKNTYDSFIKLQSNRNGRLAWLLLIAVGFMWVYNGWTLYIEYKDDIETEIDSHQMALLTEKSGEIESVMRLVYEHLRTISLLPSIRRVGGFNRIDVSENVVEQGRLSIDTHQTIQQIYRNLHSSIDLSEIYVTLKGFQPETGEVPFAMYNDEISGTIWDPTTESYSDHHAGEDYQEDEYRYFVKQLDQIEKQTPIWQVDKDITKIPALSSSLLRTCDNTQFELSAKDDPRNTNGILYSVPIFALDNQRFTGIVTAVLRANILESILVDLPFVPVTKSDYARFRSMGFNIERPASNFILTDSAYDVVIYDRHNSYVEDNQQALVNQITSDHVASVDLKVMGDTVWSLTHYLNPTEIVALTADRKLRFYRDAAIRVLLMLVFAVMLVKALRDQNHNHANLVRLAHFDSLTDLPNRRMLYLALEQALKKAQRENTMLGLMFLDVDDFGIINDSTSHSIGDAVLGIIASRLLGGYVDQNWTSKKFDIGGYTVEPLVARLGGDDFALIFENIPSYEVAEQLAYMQLSKFDQPMVVKGHTLDVKLSAGMALYPNDADEYHDLMANVDYTLKSAQSLGGGNFMMFDDEMRRQAARSNRLLRDLPDAIRQNAFNLQYQPKQSLDTDRVLSFEALIRWDHPEFGSVSPAEFVPLLEQTNNIVEVGRWVLAESCRQLKAWKDQGYIDICVSVNVSAKQLLLSDIVLTVDSILDEFDLAPNKLILEITESLMMDNLHDSSAILEKIRSRGVKLAIDDFGTGYSSLTYLQGLPIDYLKLDKSIIDLIHDERGAHLTKATIDLAHGLGLTTIAEGVEHLSQRDALKAMGCDMIQGFLLSRPLPPSELGPFLKLSRLNAEAVQSSEA